MDLQQYVNPGLTEESVLDEFCSRFCAAQPFPWLVLDGFLNEGLLARLIDEFPQPGPDYEKYCLGDDGRLGPNYANPNLKEFPDAFKVLDTVLSSPEFLRWLSRITGIDEIEYDPQYFGGGIRESAAQVFLPPHLDFNYNPGTLSHRRLNLLIYLNEDWREEWGGAIQVHRDPRVHRNDSLVASFPPILNRCFLFETSERSWHGFNRLLPPPERTRRAFTIYYYTKERPDLAALNYRNTEYVEPPLPPHMRTGYTLTPEDELLLGEAMARRDDRIVMLYRLRAEADTYSVRLRGENEELRGLSQSLREECDRLTAAAVDREAAASGEPVVTRPPASGNSVAAPGRGLPRVLRAIGRTLQRG